MTGTSTPGTIPTDVVIFLPIQKTPGRICNDRENYYTYKIICIKENFTRIYFLHKDKEHPGTHIYRQKNWSVVRHTVGYDRLEGDQQYALLQSIYKDLRLYINFFQPVLELTRKEHIGSKVICRYDIARTPDQRVLGRSDIPLAGKAKLLNQYLYLNSVELRNRIDENVTHLLRQRYP